jgi:sec-independent protein translocase protein TatA
MIFGLSTTELIVILVIIVILFGIGRITRIGGEIGGAIREFRKGISGKDKDEKKED